MNKSTLLVSLALAVALSGCSDMQLKEKNPEKAAELAAKEKATGPKLVIPPKPKVYAAIPFKYKYPVDPVAVAVLFTKAFIDGDIKTLRKYINKNGQAVIDEMISRNGAKRTSQELKILAKRRHYKLFKMHDIVERDNWTWITYHSKKSCYKSDCVIPVRQSDGFWKVPLAAYHTKP